MRSSSFFILLSISLLCILAQGAQESYSVLKRYALVAGANYGGRERVVLKYAQTDARAFARVLGELGGIDINDIIDFHLAETILERVLLNV